MTSNLTHQWAESMRRWNLELLCIPTVVITLATLLISPVLLTCILLSRALRQETRYLLVANTLTADILFLVLNLATVMINSVGAQIPWLVCELVTTIVISAYCCAILTVTLMVLDTFAAVRWPLRYHDFLTPCRTHCILVGVWILSVLYPFTSLIMVKVKEESPHEKVTYCLAFIILKEGGIYIYFFVGALICTLLILYCYTRLYMVTRTQGIWHSRFSRARVTVLAHGVLLLLYFVPGIVFTLELYMFEKKGMSQDVHVWISTVNCCVLMLLPRAFAPYLYGLRYREIADTLMLLLDCHKRLTQITLS
ncbi:probable G-protein coupled receptor 148 [Melanotaenia boesemani]|uniref:probable G-protein coupled receptor 148 n=1 Tax=Melanotaenia boesemani TaxID=1250792 RepID=UPI001C050AB3|nr:probable G-protein coupled receptor 148 [Melanotaenia boesemani]